MKNTLKLLALGAAFAAASVPAFASSIGAVTIEGTATTPDLYTAGTNNVYFSTGTVSQTVLPPSSGVFLGASTFVFDTQDISFTFGTAFTAIDVLNFQLNGSTVTFFANEASEITASEVLFDGYITGTSFPGSTTTASFELTPLANSGAPAAINGGTGYTFLGELDTPAVSPTPEPSSLVLLGSGLVSAAGVMFRKRRTLSV